MSEHNERHEQEKYEKRIEKLLEEISHQLHKINEKLYFLFRELLKLEINVTGFEVKQTGENNMATLALPDPGNTLQFTAVPTPAGAVLPAGIIPSWTSTDPTNAPVATDPTGLIAQVILSTATPVGESITLTITAIYTNAAGVSITATGSITFTVGAAVAPGVTGFTISQTA